MKMLEAVNVFKSYAQGLEKLQILSGLNLVIEKGETVAIVGQSGSGKSTLLALLAGLDIADQGEIKVMDQTLNNMSEQELTQFRAQSLSIVFQQFHLMPHLSALENIALPLQMLGKKDAYSKAEFFLNQVLLQSRGSHLPGQLSGGECQRVAIARALAVEPAVLLADEPSGNLDPQTGEQITDLLFRLVKERDTSLVLVTHNYELAKRCDRVLVLKSGQLHAQL